MAAIDKTEFRKKMALLSFSEKVAILEKLRVRGLAIAEAREKLRLQREQAAKKK